MTARKKKPTSEMPIVLNEDEIIAITGYHLAVYQKRHFDALGIPSKIRPDNTLSVGRAHWLNMKPVQAQNDAPRVRQVRRAA